MTIHDIGVYLLMNLVGWGKKAPKIGKKYEYAYVNSAISIRYTD